MNRTFMWCIYYWDHILIGCYMELTIEVPNAFEAIRIALS